MARAKSVSDEEIVLATIGLIPELGSLVTLADVGNRVGLSAATVVQRFGTKRNLMIEVVRLRRSFTFDNPFGGEGGPLERLLRGLTTFTDRGETPKELANVSSAMFGELADPELAAIIADSYRQRRKFIAGLIEEAIEAGEMKPCDPVMVARLLHVTVLGARQNWAVEPEGEQAAWVETCVRNCLASWLVADA